MNWRGAVGGLLLIFCSASGLFGCLPSDQCQNGQFRCVDNAAQNCSPIEDGNGSHTDWARSPCEAKYCRDDGVMAFCALETEPDPRCTFDDQQLTSAHCEGSTLIWCDGGYVTSRRDCAADDTQNTSEPGRCVPYTLEREYAGCI
jgi:hypothetical protein